MRLIAIVIALMAALVYITPKIRLHPASMGITNNTWENGIMYRSADGRFTVHCDFFSHDSSPYWEGQNAWEDEHVCRHLPEYLHEGLPPLSMTVGIDGRSVELRAPLFWGRLI